MIGYVTLGTNNLETSSQFYDQLLNHVGASRVLETERVIAWSKGHGHPVLSLTKPYNQQPATAGNGVMVALKLDTTDQVNQMHKLALELGAQNEGEPGRRDGGFYCAYFRDLDGNKVNFYTY